MLRFSAGVTRLDKLRNEEIGVKLDIIELRATFRKEGLSGMGHVYWREDNYVGKPVKSPVVARKERKAKEMA